MNAVTAYQQALRANEKAEEAWGLLENEPELSSINAP